MVAPMDPTCVLDLRGMYPFSDGATRKVRDFSGYSNFGTENNFAGDDSEYVDANMGQSLLFPASNRFLSFPTTASLSFTVGSFSVEYWYTPTSTPAGTHALFLYDTADYTQGFLISQIGTALNIYVNSAPPNIAIPTAFTAGSFYCIHVVADAAGGRLYAYLNGILSTSIAATWSMTASQALVSGSTGANACAPGYHHRARIWKRAIGAAEVWDRFINAARV